tara:strand:+ start:904 stop:1302 length:399 start_codon:yes stop_codon:yes gene_type:complete
MAKLTTIRVDAEKEVKGVWTKWEHGVELLIARLNNPLFQLKVRELTVSHTKEIRLGTFDGMEEVSRVAVASTVLLGWKSIEDDDGKEFKYSAEHSLELLSDPGLQDLYQFVLTQSNERDQYLVALEKDSRGN